MSDTILLQSELGQALEQRRLEAGHSIQSLARTAGKSRAVIYRLERGEASEVSSLLAVAAALGLALKLEKAVLPTLDDMVGFFDEDESEGADKAALLALFRALTTKQKAVLMVTAKALAG